MKLTTLILTITISAALIIGCSKKEPAPQPSEEKTPAPAAKVAQKEITPPVIVKPEPKPAPVEPAKLGDKAASLDGLTMIKGEPVTFTDGKVYVVEFWATWCPPCRTSIPHLTEIQNQFKDKSVTVIGISNESAETVKPFVEKMGDDMNYTVAVDTANKVGDGYMEAFGQRGIPTAFIVDAKGNVAWVGHPMDGLDEVLEQVVEGTYDAEAYAKAKAERQAAQQELGKLLQQYFTEMMGDATIEQIRPIAQKIIETNDPEALNALAWQILSAPNIDEAKRDTEIALKAAEKANTETEGKNPMILDTYALALSKTGKLAEAIVVQQKAVDLSADNERLQANLKLALEKFKTTLAEQTAEALPPAPSTEDPAALGSPVQ